MQMYSSKIIALLGLAAVAPSFSSASIVLTASDDNYVYTGDKNTNYNSESASITVKNATSNDRIAYVKFDLSSVISGVDTSQDAVLSMTFNQVTNAGSGDTAEFIFSALSNTGSPSNFAWQESTVTYNSRPTGTFTDLTPSYNWSYNASDVAHTITFSGLTNFIQADNTVTFRIFGPQLTDTGNNPSWHSSEATTVAYRPTLTLVAVPEPATASILLGLATLAIAGTKRRR